MPESVTDRPTRAHEYVFLLAKSERYYYDADAIREPYAPASIERISQPNFENQTGGPKDYSNGINRHRSARKALEGLAASHKGSSFSKGKTGVNGQGRVSEAERHDNPAGRNKRTVWEIATQPYPEAHFATFPETLVRPCILAGSREGDTILDPFGGSGTVGVVARKAGRRAVLIDLSPAYCEMARERFRQAVLV
jgi:DNA modification methylase